MATVAHSGLSSGQATDGQLPSHVVPFPRAHAWHRLGRISGKKGSLVMYVTECATFANVKHNHRYTPFIK